MKRRGFFGSLGVIAASAAVPAPKQKPDGVLYQEHGCDMVLSDTPFTSNLSTALDNEAGHKAVVEYLSKQYLRRI